MKKLAWHPTQKAEINRWSWHVTTGQGGDLWIQCEAQTASLSSTRARWWDLGRAQAPPAAAFQLSRSRSHEPQERLHLCEEWRCWRQSQQPISCWHLQWAACPFGGLLFSWVTVLVNVLPSLCRAGSKALRALGLEETRAPGPLALGFSFEGLRRVFSLSARKIPSSQMPSDWGRGEGSASGCWLLLSLLLCLL